MLQTLDQKRAADACGKIEQVKSKHSKDTWSATYVSSVESLPAAILNCGLGQAAATLLSAAKGKTDDPHHCLYDHLRQWLCGDEAETPYRNQSDLMKAITSHDRAAYMKAQAEALSWLNWLKKLAVAYLKQEQGGNDDVYAQ